MSADAPPDRNVSTDPEQLKKTWEGWSGLVTAVSPTATLIVGVGVTLAFGSLADKYQQYVNAAGVALTLAAVGGWVYYRRRHSKAGPAAASGGAPPGRQAAFRGLYSFGENDDDVPGETRQREAATCATQIQNTQFAFGVISGETGAGKSSLLACGVQRRLRQAGVLVLFVPSPRSLCQRAAPAQGPDLAEVRRDLQALKDRVAARLAKADPAPEYLVLLIDQFEEWMIDYPLPEQRRALGEGLAELMRGRPPVKVVVAVRKDYLLDLHDLRDSIPEPLAAAAVTYLKNFTVEEASEIIKECARRDGVPLGAGFAERVARDLSEKNFVRPPELQIICTELRGSLNLTSYAQAQGAAGILSGHVEKSLVGCPDAGLARRLLRELCDFPARAKKNPETTAEIRDKLRALPSVSAAGLDAVLGQTLDHLEKARLLRAERRGAEGAYCLAQDYLVDAIALVTRDVSTRAEEAEHVVNYYLGEARDQPAGWRRLADPLIPWSKLRFVRRNADRALLQRPDVRGLLRESGRAHAVRFAGWAALALLAAFLLSNVVTYEWSWQLESADHHWPDGLHGSVMFEPIDADGKTRQIASSSTISSQAGAFPYYVSGPGGVAVPVATQVVQPVAFTPAGDVQSTYPKMYVRVWRADDASWVTGFSGRLVPTLPSEPPDFILMARSAKDAPARIAVRRVSDLTASWREIGLPPQALFGFTTAVLAGPYLAYTGGLPGEAQALHVYDLEGDGEADCLPLERGEQVAAVLPPRDGRPLRVVLRTFTPVRPSGAAAPVRWKLELALWSPRGKRASLAEGNDASLFAIAADPATGKVALLAPTEPGGELELRLWSGDSPTLAASQPLGDAAAYRSAYLRFSPNGSYLEVFGGGGLSLGFPKEVRQASDLRPCPEFRVAPGDQGRVVVGRGGLWLAWPGEDKATWLWDLGAGKPKKVAGLELTDGQNIILDGKGDKAVVIEGGEHVTLWDLARSQSFPTFDVQGGVYGADFTLGENAFFVRKEGGGLLLFAAADGLPVNQGQKITELPGVGGDSQVVSYDASNRRINVWTSEGRVLRYRQTWNVWMTHWAAGPPKKTAPERAPDDEPREKWESHVPFLNPTAVPAQYTSPPFAAP